MGGRNMNDDIEHLRYLAIGHYVFAAITALTACLPLIHLSIGLIFLFESPPTESGELFPTRIFGLIFALIGGALVIGGWALAAMVFTVGRSLAARRRHTFCVVVAAICCAIFPLGTALGVLTILVLTRPTVKAMFQRPAGLDAPLTSTPGPGAWRNEASAETPEIESHR